jgi:hypothetical protein
LIDLINELIFVRYRWEKNGKEFNWQVYDNRISQQPGRGTLVITQPKREDIGEAKRGRHSETSLTKNADF